MASSIFLLSVDLHCRTRLHSSIPWAAFWTREPQALSQGFVWFHLWIRFMWNKTKKLSKLRRKKKHLRKQVQVYPRSTYRLSWLPPVPALRCAVCIPLWSWACETDARWCVWRTGCLGKKLRRCPRRRRRRRTTEEKKLRTLKRVEEPRLPLLHRLLLIGLEVHTCHLGLHRWKSYCTGMRKRQVVKWNSMKFIINSFTYIAVGLVNTICFLKSMFGHIG